MLSRVEFYDLEENLLELGIEISEITKRADDFVTYINSAETSLEIVYRIDMVRKAEDKTKEMIQIIISKTNPDLNKIIGIDSLQNDSHKLLIYCLGLVQYKIEKQKEDLIHKLSNIEKIQSNKVTNKATLDFYASYLKNVVNDIVINPLKEAFSKFSMIEEPATNSKDYIKQFVKDFGEGSIIKIEKNETLFWYLVFSYLFRASQVIGFISEAGKLVPKPIDITDIKKLIRVAQKQVPVQGQRIEQVKEELPEKKEKEQKREIPEIRMIGEKIENEEIEEDEEEEFDEESDEEEY